MKIGVNLKIDVTKIDKEKLFRGEKGTYLDSTVFIDIDNKGEWGDNGMITQDLTKAERDAGVKTGGAILGNATVFWSDGNKQAPKQSKPQAPIDFDDAMPF